MAVLESEFKKCLNKHSSSVICLLAAHPSAHYVPNARRFPKNTADSADSVLLRGFAWSCGRYWLSLQRLSASITILPITTPLETVVVRLFNLQLLHSYCWLCLTCTNLYHAGKHSAWDDTRSLIKTLTSGGMVLKNKSYPRWFSFSQHISQKLWPTRTVYHTVEETWNCSSTVQLRI